MKIQLRKRLGDLLIEEGIVSEDQVQQALNAQHSTGQKLGDALIDLGFISEKQMLEFLSQQLSLPLIDLSRAPVDARCGANSSRSTRASFTCHGCGS